MLQIIDIHKQYKTGALVQDALDGVSLSFRENEFVAILGPSGSGKTTLLNIIGGLDHADSGELLIDGVPTSRYKSRDWDSYRNHSVGFIFQSYNLIPHQTILSNVELAMTLAGIKGPERKARAREELERVGLHDHMHKKPLQLSGGQMQRVAIARALVNHPSIVLADEPTGALDSDTGVQVMELLREVARDHLVVMVTHNPELARQYATRIISLRDGRVISDTDPFDAGRTEDDADRIVSVTTEAGGDLTEKAADDEVVIRKAPSDEAVTGKAPSDTSGSGTFEDKDTGHGNKEAGPGCENAKTEPAHPGSQVPDKKRKPSMSFLTALSLSVSNLLSKKTRTLLVAFAASIGITGIALILSLSTGAHSYISHREEEALSQYPLQISSSSFSMEASMMAMSQLRSQSAELSDGSKINENQFLGALLSGTGTNDLKSLKKWFESGKSTIENYTRDISYSYGISPQVYHKETDGSYRQVNPDQTMSAMGLTMSDNMSGMMSIWNGNDLFMSLPDNPDIYEGSYKLLAGTWPKNDTDCVLVLLSDGQVPDFLLYTMGLKDSKELEEMITGVMTGEQVDTSLSSSTAWNPDEFLGIRFRILPACRRFSYDEKLGVWLDHANDNEIMSALLDDADELVIKGVVAPESDSSAGLLGYGIQFRPELMERLLLEAGDSDVVRAQLKDPDTDVLTGAPFGSDAEDPFANMADMVEIHPEKIPDAVSVDYEELARVLEDHFRIYERKSRQIIKELLLDGSSATFRKIMDHMLPAIFDLIEIDETKIADVISMEMDEERMQEFYMARSAAGAASYSGNLIRFGYADPESPNMIQIYPNDFESKDEVIRLLDDYNQVMEDEGHSEKVISYTDYVGALMSSVTSIIDVITYVLIAFVAVSLVVSSIMIGIITYISVLERRKEIGILRAMGASRHNITQVFNAETFIIGIMAGVFGIVITLLAQIPINAAIHSYTTEPVSTYLPPESAVILIILCIVLNLIGGFIPARKASKQDPVAALRSE